VSGLQAGNALMASNLIGPTLYTTANENVGDIVIDKNGTTKGMVVGVGGFLGVPLDRDQVGRDENNSMKLDHHCI